MLRSLWAIPNCWFFLFKGSYSGSTLALHDSLKDWLSGESRNNFDFKESVSAHCLTKCITSKIRINTPVISFCKSYVVAWKKHQSYEILQFFQNYFKLWLILVSIEILIGLLSQTKSTSAIQQVLGSLERLPAHFDPDQNLKLCVFVYAASAI